MKKSAFLLLLLLFNISLFAQNEESGMPIFPTCDTTVSQEEAKMCTEQKLLKYINNNLVYPSISLTHSVFLANGDFPPEAGLKSSRSGRRTGKSDMGTACDTPSLS